MSSQCTESYEDLEQIAIIGLIKAAEKFDPAKGAAFSSFAVPYIRGEIQHFIRDQWGAAPKVPRRAIEEYSKVRRIQKELSKRGRELPESEIAAGLGISASRWQWVSEARSRKPLVSLDEMAIAIGTPEPEETDERAWLYQQIECMPELQRVCVIEHYFSRLAVEEIARRRNISHQFCQVLIDQAIESLRRMAKDA